MSDLRSQLQAALGSAYTLERELDSGGMSRVFVADEVQLGRRVVVKVLSPELAAGISAERFKREIRLAASLQQANIVPVLATGDTNGLPYYTMPFVEGESLRRRLAKQPPLSISDTVRILGDVARALQYAHEHGIVHRDIKPDNVLLSGGTAVVTDFGIAKALSVSRSGLGATLTQSGTSIGTPAYMAPEQAAGDPQVDHRADLYALGCMAYEVLAGRPPFHGRSPQRVLAAHLSEPPQPIAELRPDAPIALCDLVMRCLAKDAAARPPSAAEVILALNGVASGTGPPLPLVLLQGHAAFRRALGVYVVSLIAVAVAANAATVTIGLPSWVLPGALVIMALGLAAIIFTGYAQSVARRTLTTAPVMTRNGQDPPRSKMESMALRASAHVSWKRTTRGVVYTLSAFVVLIVAFMTMRALGIGPPGSLFAAGKLSQRDLVLVSDFAASRADSSVASVVAEGVRANLVQSPSITLFNPARVAAGLRRMQLPPTSRLDLALARQLAQREGIRAIITGNVTGLGNGFVIALRLVTPDSGIVLAAFQTTVEGSTTLVRGVDKVTRTLRGKIGESLRSVQASPPLEQVTTASYEALRAFTEGNRAFDVEHDFSRAIPPLQRAVSIDTGFASAWRKLATAYSNAGHSSSEVDSAITKAFELRSRLSDNERYLTEGYYYMVGPGHDRQRALAAYQALLDRGDTVYAANNLAVVYASEREFAKAESLYRLSARKSPDNMVPMPNLAAVLFVEGKRAAFDSVRAVAWQRLPNNATLIYYDVSLDYHAGRYDKFEHRMDSVRKATTSLGVRTMATIAMSEYLALRGRLADAERRYHDAMSAMREQGAANVAASDSALLASFDTWYRGQPRRAALRLDAALAAHPLASLPERDRPYADLAEHYARAGRPDRARALLAQLAASKDTAYLRSAQPFVHRGLAEIALAEKRYNDAIVEFRRGDTASDGRPAYSDAAWVCFNLGRAFDLANEPDSVIASFEAYLNTNFIDRLDDDYVALAGIHKRLGELYDTKGDREKAISHLSKFVELWKNADPELQPTVSDAKRRLTRLQAGVKS